ncbi:MAG: recombination protein RecR [Alphaproteobacteria bacterium]|nr:recombination protein RecR [Alphaproteobacteria bacterium]
MISGHGSVIQQLIQHIGKLPGLGNRSAKRIVLHLVKHRETLLPQLVQTLEQFAQHIKVCDQCGNIDEQALCEICSDEGRDRKLLCVVEDVTDLWAMERSRVYRGLYHVLGGTLSAIDGRGPQQLRITQLITMIKDHQVEEVILATNATIDGQTTAHYITEQLKELGLKRITRLAQGIPMGGELDYLDEGTLNAAMRSRQSFLQLEE